MSFQAVSVLFDWPDTRFYSRVWRHHVWIKGFASCACAFHGHLATIMRQEHRSGEKMFVDYAGQTVPVIGGEPAKSASRRSPSSARPATPLPKSLVAKAARLVGLVCQLRRYSWRYLAGPGAGQLAQRRRLGHCYQPVINPRYRDSVENYGGGVLPARSRKPKDKSKVEAGMQLVERWILTALQNRQFFSLDELNTALTLLLDDLNQKPFKKLPGSRRSAFDTIDQPALQPLSDHPYVEPNGKRCGYTSTAPSCLHNNQRAASHLRSQHKGRHSIQT